MPNRGGHLFSLFINRQRELLNEPPIVVIVFALVVIGLREYSVAAPYPLIHSVKHFVPDRTKR
jgi:uncharacterized YccA/Bax inhibitor family protein